MRKKFCPQCGRDVEQLYRNLCRDCFLSKVSVVKDIPNKIRVGTCKNCGKIYLGDKSFFSIDEAVNQFISQLLKLKNVKDIKYEIGNNRIHLKIYVELEGLVKQEEKIVSLILKSITCKQCSMKFVGYYQSIIQVRAPERLLNLIQREIENQVSGFGPSKLAFISKTEKVRNGLDIYIGSKRIANQIAKNVKEKFNAKIKISRKLSGTIRGKTVSRDTILISIGD